MDPEQSARASLPPGVFDSLPQAVKDSLMAAERDRARLQLLEAKEAARDEEDRKKEAADQEQREYEERQARAAALSREQLRKSGIVERIGQSQEDRTRTRLNRIEAGHIEMSCEFPDNEPDPVSLIGGFVHGFRRQTIDALVPQIQEIMQKANSYNDVQRSATAYMVFHLWTGNQRRAGTRAVALSDNDIYGDVTELYDALAILLADIERVKEGYEYIFNGEEKTYMHFYFRANYYPNPRDVRNWGDDIKEIETRDCFDIFTAPDISVPCAVQVARRLWGPDAAETTIDQIVERAMPNVCIVKPHSTVKSFKGVNDYSDLVIEARSPVKSLSVIKPTTVYLLHFNEHVGLLENVKEQKRRVTQTSFRPVMEFPKTQKVTMCFDIECSFDPERNQDHVPFMCCACFVYDDVPGNVMEFRGRDSVAQMLDYAAENVEEFGLKNIELIAHNGGAYDFHYVLTSMFDPSIIKNLLVRNNDFISYSFTHCGVKFSVKDSYNFISCSLRNAAKSFLDEQDRKTDFPHHEMRSAEDLQRVFAEWISVDKEIHVNVEKEKMMISVEHVVKYAENPEYKKLIDWSAKYCVNDVVVLAKVWIRFKQLVYEVFGCHIVDQTHTLAGMSFRLFEANLPVSLPTHTGYGKIKLYNPLKVDFFNMRAALVGGRCISVNGMHENVVCLDVKSLYPAAMAYYEQPYGQYRRVTGEVASELGIYYCHVEPVAVKGHGFFPLKHGKKRDVSYSGVSEAYNEWYTSVDMKIGRAEGHTITPIKFEGNFVGYSWKHKGLIFKDYIEGVLYKLKLRFEKAGEKEKRAIIKLVMNSLWGKFAQKWMDTKYDIKTEADCDMANEECYKIWDTEWFLVKKHENKKYSSKPVQNGVFTLSWARYHMFVVWQKAVVSGTECLYSDTDSIMVLRKHLILDATFELNGRTIPVIGDEMGQLEIENVFHELLCVGKKQYMGKHGPLTEPEYKKRFKGVPQDYITPDMYTHLLKSKDHTVQVNFLKFKREWGSVKGYIEKKTVRQT